MGKQSDCLPVFRFKMPQIHLVEAETVGAVGNGGQAFAFCDSRNVAVSYGCAVNACYFHSFFSECYIQVGVVDINDRGCHHHNDSDADYYHGLSPPVVQCPGFPFRTCGCYVY